MVCAPESRGASGFLVLVLAWGLGLLLYVGLWLLMPDGGRDSAQGWRRRLRQRAHGMRDDVSNWSGRVRAGWREVGRDPWPRPLGRRWMAILLIASGAFALLASLGAFSWLTPLRAASAAMMLVGAGVLINLRN